MKGFLRILEELDYPPIYLIPNKQFEMIEGEGLPEENKVSQVIQGLSAAHYPVITLYSGLRGKKRDNVIYHEIAHHLWPWKHHWWIEMAAERLAGGGGRGFYSTMYNKSLDDVPSRNKLLKMARRQSEKLKEQYKIKREKTR